MHDELVSQTVALPGGELRLLQPRESAELPDDGGVEWAPLVPFWSVLWRSGVALAAELSAEPLRGLRVVELGCGMAVPGIAAARAGAAVLATDRCEEALALVERNARANGVRLETARFDWASGSGPCGAGSNSDTPPWPDLVRRGPFDVALAADVLYERSSAAPLVELLPRLAPEAWVADPGRPTAGPFFEEAGRRWQVETRERGVVRIHRLRFGWPP